ncbi:hypothetical protein PRIPAC_97166 [Pristionchus pacificus]|uniref:Uncharacterized protein n=1 Tax=Pristionchus pacificus TaxID=54126 RepID=A0A2A6BBY6_PRIPA|nr:hypothetical protein PRIPAC_97166 [Pristionchus pacificus]|eukprot:PDM63390.1 hypothetical protein PRIPAC_53747 [Pristionchus pacificus]
MAQILSLDGNSAKLRSPAGRIIERPINLLIPLELQSQVPPELSGIKSRNDMFESIDEEAALLVDPQQPFLEKIADCLFDEMRALSTQFMGLDLEIVNNRDAIQENREAIIIPSTFNEVNTFRNIYGSKLRRGIQAISYAKASRGFS